MAFFKEAPIKGLTRERDSAIVNRDRLAARLTAAEQAVIDARTLAQRHALSGDDSALDAAEQAEGAAVRRLNTIVAAHAEAEGILTLVEGEIAVTLEKKLRAASAAETNTIADELVQAGAGFDIAIGVLADVSSRAGLISFEATGLANFSTSSRIQVSEAVEVVSQLLREHGRAILNHQAAAALPKPAPEPAKAAPVVKEPLTAVFATRPIRWKDHDGIVRSSSKFLDCELPVRTAAHALKIGAALPLDHPERKRNLGMWPGHVSLAMCFDLDAAPDAPPQHDPVVHSAFQPIDRGKPFTLKIAAGGS